MIQQFEFDDGDSLWLRYKHQDGRDLAVWFGNFGFKDMNIDDIQKLPEYKRLSDLVQELGEKVFKE